MISDDQKKMATDFILERIKPGKEGDAKNLISEVFDKLVKDGDLGKMFIATKLPTLLNVLKPEHIDEVKDMIAKLQKG